MLVAIRWHNYQWDFYLAYGSGKDFLHGVSPYRGEGLSFYQAPLTLYLYSLLARLPFFLAYELWIALKLCALVGLLWIWDRHFLRLARTWWMATYLLLLTPVLSMPISSLGTYRSSSSWVSGSALPPC